MSRQALERLSERFGSEVLSTTTKAAGDDIAVVRPESILAVARFLKEELDFKLPLSVTCVDRLLLPEPVPRFELVYLLRCLTRGEKVIVKARVPADRPEIDSVTPIWKGADWWERMVFDLYGVRFTGHPNLKRIYLYQEFEGHPLRKDYPVRRSQPLVKERPVQTVPRGPGAAKPTP